MIRTHTCGDLRAADAGTSVVLAGWVHSHRDHGGVEFLDVRDGTGVVQVVCESGEPLATAHTVRDEWCVKVTGAVRARPEGTVNPKLPTGEIEVVAGELEVLSECPPLPFPVEDHVDAEETTRLRFRFVDLRRAPMQQAMRVRAQVRKAIREHFEEHDFVEVETPILARATPEGARDFLVPSRHQPGSFFALAQSPQLYKQVLMVGGVERYYQLAPCFRDEDPRADRQVEHVQLDFEMAFCERDDILGLVEGLMARVWRDVRGAEIVTPFPRISFADAIDRYGTDRPDLRDAAGPTVVDLSEVFAGTGFKAFGGVLEGGGAVRGLRVPGAGSEASRAVLDALIDRAKELGAKGLVWMVVEPDELRAPITKFLSDAEQAGIRSALEAEVGDLVLLAADEPRLCSEILGTMRIELAKRDGRITNSATPDDWRFCWIVDMPMFERDDQGVLQALGNPFYAPQPDSLPLLDTEPERALSQQYDLVINGMELLSGSIRIHRADVQRKIFAVLGLTDDEIAERFGWFVDALAHGAPPHGGVGMGLDRVLLALTGGDSLRDVIAFPKTQTGADLMTGAPAPVDPAALRESGLSLRKKD